MPPPEPTDPGDILQQIADGEREIEEPEEPHHRNPVREATARMRTGGITPADADTGQSDRNEG